MVDNAWPIGSALTTTDEKQLTDISSDTSLKMRFVTVPFVSCWTVDQSENQVGLTGNEVRKLGKY